MTTEMFPEVVPAEDPNRRYTPDGFNKLIKGYARVSGWDLDVAADEESHLARRWFSLLPYAGSAGVNGLEQWWLPGSDWAWWDGDRGPLIDAPLWRIFCNPPFDGLEPWLAKTWQTLVDAQALRMRVVIAMVLPGNRHEQPFWQEHVEPHRFEISRAARFGYELVLHHPPGRQAYAKPGSNGVAVGSADFPSAVLVWKQAA